MITANEHYGICSTSGLCPEFDRILPLSVPAFAGDPEYGRERENLFG